MNPFAALFGLSSGGGGRDLDKSWINDFLDRNQAKKQN